MNQLTLELEYLAKPDLPSKWDYEESVKKVGKLIYKWKNLTLEIAQELWIAREMLSHSGRPPIFKKTGANAPVRTLGQMSRSWDNYCDGTNVPTWNLLSLSKIVSLRAVQRLTEGFV